MEEFISTNNLPMVRGKLFNWQVSPNHSPGFEMNLVDYTAVPSTRIVYNPKIDTITICGVDFESPDLSLAEILVKNFLVKNGIDLTDTIYDINAEGPKLSAGARDPVVAAVQLEMQRQDVLWGIQNHDMVSWVAILTEEVGEAAKKAVDYKFENRIKKIKKESFESQVFYDQAVEIERSDNLKNYRYELIQVAAVAIQAVKSLDRQKDIKYEHNT